MAGRDHGMGRAPAAEALGGCVVSPRVAGWSIATVDHVVSTTGPAHIMNVLTLGGPTVQVPYAFLDRQFEDPEPYLDEMREIIAQGNFTLGEPVEQFERQFAAYCGVPHAVGVASGTDALMLALQAVGVGHGDEVITVSATFIATVGAIASVGARPVFVDVDDGIVMDPGAGRGGNHAPNQSDPARPLDRQHGRHATPEGDRRSPRSADRGGRLPRHRGAAERRGGW